MQTDRIKLVVFALLAGGSVIVMGVLAQCNVGYFEQNTIRHTQDRLLTIADVQATHIEEIFNEIKSDLEIVALSPAVSKRIRENAAESELPPEDYYPLEDVFGRLKKVASSFYRIDANGIVQQRVPFKEGREGADFSRKPGVAYVLENHESHISKVFLTDLKERAVSICVPVLDGEEFVGILRGIAYLDTLHGILCSIGVTDRTAAFLVNEDGEVLTSSSNIIEVDTLVSHHAENNGDEDEEGRVVSEILSGRQGSACLRFDELAYDKAVIGWAPIKAGERTWSIIVCEDYDNISAPIKSHSRNIFILVACFSTILVGIGLAFHRVNKRKTQLEALVSLNRMNEELQHISDERTQTASELEEQDNLLKSIIGALPHAVFWKDANSRYRGCNKKFAVLMGHDKPSQIIGKTDYDIEINKELADLYSKHYTEVMKTGIGLLNVEQTHQLPDGTEVDVLTSVVPLKDTTGKVTGVIGVFRQTAEIEKVRKGISAAGSKLTNAISSMDHGLIITDLSGTITDVNEYYADIMGASVEQLRGKSIYDCITEPANKNLVALVRKLAKSSNPEPVLIHHGMGERDFQIRVQPILKDGTLEGALINVIDISELTKARKRAEYASYSKTRLLASLSHRIRTPMNSIIGFTDLLEQENLTGEQAKFAEMISSSAGNLLEVVNEIIELYNEYPEDIPDENTVQSDSAPDEEESDAKTISNESNSEQPKSASTGSSVENAFRILIVDDVVENRMLVEVLLKKNGYSTVSCSDGKQAVNLAEKEQYDLILMDIQMPEMDGLEATQIIRSDGMNSATPILAMTASVATEDEILCLGSGCDDYVRKPINKELLLKKIWRFGEQKKQINAALEGDEIVSFLSDNPDYHKAIEAFVKNLPGRIKEMQQALDAENLQDLNFKVHALKGVGGFAGFPVYSELAKSIEQSIKNSHIDEIKEKLDEMVNICRRTKLTPR